MFHFEANEICINIAHYRNAIIIAKRFEFIKNRSELTITSTI